MYGEFSEDALAKYQEVLNYLADRSTEFSEEGTYDFTRCIRPNGSAYGTRGVCQPPNRVAPKQDVSATNQKDFIAGGGLTAVQKGSSSAQVVNRGRDARARAFEAGGGRAAMAKGKSREEVERSGAQARAEAYKAGGGDKLKVIDRSGKIGTSKNITGGVEEAIKLGKENRAAAFKAGGGDAAVKAGKRVADVVKEGAANLKAAYEAGGGSEKYKNLPLKFGKKDLMEQGKENLKRVFEAGGGEAARAQGLSIKEIMDKGKKSLAEAYEAGGGTAAKGKAKDVAAKGAERLKALTKIGGGNVERGKDILDDPIGFTNRSKFRAGGGETKMSYVVEELERKRGRKLNQEEVDDIRARVAGLGAEILTKYFQAGGGVKALESGKSVDEVIDIGESIAKRDRKQKKEEAARNIQNRLAKESQFV